MSRSLPFERDALYIAQAERFLDAAQGTAAVPCSLEDGLQTLRVNLAALASRKPEPGKRLRAIDSQIETDP